MATIRKIVQLTDPEYFCNKSWTLSYNLNTGSWISFHSYIPNWYIGENNFFYSGINTCCSNEFDFDFLAGELVPNPPTTTTTTTWPVLTTTSTTTVAPPDCDLSGIITLTDCILAGTGVITIPPVIPPCQRPSGMITDFFITGYTILAGPTVVVSTGSSTDACNAYTYRNSTDPTLYTTQDIQVQYASLGIGYVIYSGNGTDCTYIADGWYFTYYSTGDVYHVVGGVITEIVNCNPTTTTTTTTTPPVQTFKVIADNNFNAEILGVTPNFYTLNPGNAFPVSGNQTITGVVNQGKSSISVQYSNSISNTKILIYVNGVEVKNTLVSIGSNLSYGFLLTFLATDEVTIVLTQ